LIRNYISDVSADYEKKRAGAAMVRQPLFTQIVRMGGHRFLTEAGWNPAASPFFERKK